jgi:plastocyanin domain-containing protein
MKAWLLGVLVLVVGVAAHATAEPREIEIIVEHGYSPRSIDIAPGEAVRLKVIRKEYTPCTKDIVFPSLGITRELPVGQPVLIDIPAQSSGEVPFRCGMNMVKGVLVVKGSS